MKCQNCGKELARGSSFCTACGARVENSVSVGSTVLRKAFSSTYFLVLSILVTVSAVLNTDAIKILFTVACWIIYADAKSSVATGKVTGYKFLHVVFKIQYILVWVAAGITAVSGVVGAVILLISRSFASTLLGFAVEYSAEVSDVLSDTVAYLARALTSIPMAVLAAVSMLAVMLVGVAVMCIFNWIFTRSFVKYSEGLVKAAEKGDSELKALDHSGTAVRMLIWGIITALQPITSILSASISRGRWHIGNGLGGLCFAAAYIIAYLMIKEYSESNKAK